MENMVRIGGPGAVVTTVRIQGFDGSNWQSIRVDPSSHLDVNIGGLSALAQGQVILPAATETIIRVANTSRKAIHIKNMHASEDCYVGPATVTSSDSYLLKAGGGAGSEITLRTTAQIRGYSIGASRVCYLEE